MKHRHELVRLALLLGAVMAACTIPAAAAEEAPPEPAPPPAQQVSTNRAGRALALPEEKDAFHFVIFGDRTGGPAEGIRVLAQAVEDTNLLDPDLVMTVGDLINGYNQPAEWMAQMEEYRDTMGRLRMPWFPVAGNHDVYWRGPDRPPDEHEEAYEKHFGPLWYWFEHKGCGFLVLYTDEGDPSRGAKDFGNPDQIRMSERQLAFLRGSLDEMKHLDQVFVFMHHPRWIERRYPDGNWEAVHAALAQAGNVAAVFAGHIHRLHYGGSRDGIEYFTLAAVGAHIPFENIEVGYAHHLNVVTVRPGGFEMAVVPVGVVVDPRRFTEERQDEIDRLRGFAPERVSAPMHFDANGLAAGFYRVRVANPTGSKIEGDLMADAAGGRWILRPDHLHFELGPGEEREIGFSYARTASGFGEGFSIPRLRSVVEYVEEDGRVRLPERSAVADHALEPLAAAAFARPEGAEESVIAFDGRGGAVAVPAEALDALDGPITVEAWIHPRRTQEKAGILSKAEKSAFVLSVSDGVPRFEVHTGGEFRKAEAGAPLVNERWTHAAGIYDGSEVRLHLDGRLVASVAAPGPVDLSTLPLLVGADPDGIGRPQFGFDGRIDEVRISRGVRYPRDAPFVPERRHVRDADTVVLLHFDEAFGPFHPSDDEAGRHARAVGSGGAIEPVADLATAGR